MKEIVFVKGGGIGGLTYARNLALKDKLSVILADKEDELGMHASGRSSCVNHSGINQRPGSLKANFCIKGNRMLTYYCEKMDVPIEKKGTLVVALSESELPALHALFKNGVESGVPGLQLLKPRQFENIEPMAKGIEALFSPTGCIFDSKALIRALENELQGMGVTIMKGIKVYDVEESSNEVVIKTNHGFFAADFFANFGGLHADKTAHKMGVGRDYKVVGFRGDYLEFPGYVESMIYPVPDPDFPFLGTHFTKNIDGGSSRVIIGPTATISFAGREGYQGGVTFEGLLELASRGPILWGVKSRFKSKSRKMIKHNIRLSREKEYFVEEAKKLYRGDIPIDEIKPYRSGMRAQLIDKRGNFVNDFLIKETDRSLHVMNMVSPGMSSAFAFAEYLDNITRMKMTYEVGL